jgi:acyl dehydratase
MASLSSSQGWYFEEFKPGQRVVTEERTVSESDVMAFAGLTGDFNPIHTDAEFARSTPYGQRIAHGLLCLSIAVGLTMRSGFMSGTVLAFREIGAWKFVKPVFLGDRLHAELEVKETKALPRIGAGTVVLGVEVKNQGGETTMRGSWTALVQSRP